MFVSELLYKRKLAKHKIHELLDYLSFLSKCSLSDKIPLYTTCINELCSVFDSLNSYDILLSEVNSSYTVSIGKDELPVYKAVLLMKGCKNKIKVFTEVIQGEDPSVDVFGLIKQRDNLYDMYNSLRFSLDKFNVETQISV